MATNGVESPTRTANGTTDLLDEAATATHHLTDTPKDDVANFAIDEDDVGHYEGAPAADDDDDDDDVKESEDHQQLTHRTSQIMEDYQDYITELKSDPLPLDPEEGVLLSTVASSGTMDPPEEYYGDYDSRPFLSVREGRASRIMRGMRNHRSHFRRNYRDNSDRSLDIHDLEEREMGGFVDDLHEELGMTGGDRKRYRYTVARTKGFKRCVGCTVLLAIVAIIVGVTTSQNGKKLPDWEAELADVLKEEEDKLHNKLHGNDNNPTSSSSNSDSGATNADMDRPAYTLEGTDSSSANAQSLSEAYETNTIKYKPNWYGRGDGWAGQSYDEAILFCAKHDRIICAYEGEQS